MFSPCSGGGFLLECWPGQALIRPAPFAVTTRQGTVCVQTLQHTLTLRKFQQFFRHEILNPLGGFHALSVCGILQTQVHVWQQQYGNP